MALSYWGGLVGSGCVRASFSGCWCLCWLVRYFIGLAGSVDFWLISHWMACFMWGSDRPWWVLSRRRMGALIPPSSWLVVR